MDSPFFALFIWTVIGAVYGVLFWSLYLAITMKIQAGSKILICIGIVFIQPFASLIFMGWYFKKYNTLKRI